MEKKRRQLYKVFRHAKREKRKSVLIRDKLYIDNELYQPKINTVIENAEISNLTKIREKDTTSIVENSDGIHASTSVSKCSSSRSSSYTNDHYRERSNSSLNACRTINGLELLE